MGAAGIEEPVRKLHDLLLAHKTQGSHAGNEALFRRSRAHTASRARVSTVRSFYPRTVTTYQCRSDVNALHPRKPPLLTAWEAVDAAQTGTGPLADGAC
jgi:hypothetical protein